jgi:hypothetical protein
MLHCSVQSQFKHSTKSVIVIIVATSTSARESSSDARLQRNPGLLTSPDTPMTNAEEPILLEYPQPLHRAPALLHQTIYQLVYAGFPKHR